MAKSLVVVESPAKARTLGRFLGNRYRVEASFGHVRDLPESAREVPDAIRKEPWDGSASTRRGVHPLLRHPLRQRRHVQSLKTALKEASEVLLATDRTARANRSAAPAPGAQAKSGAADCLPRDHEERCAKH